MKTAANALLVVAIGATLAAVGFVLWQLAGDTVLLVYIVAVATALFVYAMIMSGMLSAASIMRSTLGAWVEAQAADDKGEIERMRGLRTALGHDLKGAPKSQPDDAWRDVTPMLAAPQTWTPAHLPAQTGSDVVYYTED